MLLYFILFIFFLLLEQWSSTCGSWASSVIITWELVRNVKKCESFAQVGSIRCVVGSGGSPIRFNKPSGQFGHSLECDNSFSRY